MKLILGYPPSANRYWRHDRGIIHRSAEAEEYIRGVQLICMAERITPFAGDVCLSVDFHRPAKRGDLDNLLKVTIDALRGFAYLDDKQITEIHAMRHEDKHEPRAVVFVTEQP